MPLISLNLIACMKTGQGGPHVTNTTAKVEDRWGIRIQIQGAAGERHRLQGHESRALGSRGGGPCGRDHRLSPLKQLFGLDGCFTWLLCAACSVGMKVGVNRCIPAGASGAYATSACTHESVHRLRYALCLSHRLSFHPALGH